METQQLKLGIIQRITACNDPELLQIIFEMLEGLASKGSSIRTADPSQQTLLNVLLQEPASKQEFTPPNTEDLQDLQDSIDEIFGQS